MPPGLTSNFVVVDGGRLQRQRVVLAGRAVLLDDALGQQVVDVLAVARLVGGEHVVERAVLTDDDDDVLDRRARAAVAADPRAPRRRGDGRLLLNGRRRPTADTGGVGRSPAIVITTFRLAIHLCGSPSHGYLSCRASGFGAAVRWPRSVMSRRGLVARRRARRRPRATRRRRRGRGAAAAPAACRRRSASARKATMASISPSSRRGCSPGPRS